MSEDKTGVKELVWLLRLREVTFPELADALDGFVEAYEYSLGGNRDSLRLSGSLVLREGVDLEDDKPGFRVTPVL